MGCAETRTLYIRKDTSYRLKYTLGNQFNMYAAIVSNNVSEVANILKNGFDVNYKMSNFARRSPLHVAAEVGSVKIMKLLLEHEANPNSQDYHGVSPVFLAVQYKHFECVMLLIENGADIDLITKGNSTLFDYVPEDQKSYYKHKIFDIYK